MIAEKDSQDAWLDMDRPPPMPPCQVCGKPACVQYVLGVYCYVHAPDDARYFDALKGFNG